MAKRARESTDKNELQLTEEGIAKGYLSEGGSVLKGYRVGEEGCFCGFYGSVVGKECNGKRALIQAKTRVPEAALVPENVEKRASGEE